MSQSSFVGFSFGHTSSLSQVFLRSPSHSRGPGCWTHKVPKRGGGCSRYFAASKLTVVSFTCGRFPCSSSSLLQPNHRDTSRVRIPICLLAMYPVHAPVQITRVESLGEDPRQNRFGRGQSNPCRSSPSPNVSSANDAISSSSTRPNSLRSADELQVLPRHCPLERERCRAAVSELGIAKACRPFV
jgi:hypothetical protein